MRPPAFAYQAPEETAEVCLQLERHGAEARILAGGQSLLPLLNLREERPGVLIDIGRVAELRRVSAGPGVIVVGAATPQRDLELAAELDALPILRTVLAHVGHVTTRNRGTVGGSIAFGDPAAELPLALLVLGGQVTAQSAAGTRVIEARDLYVGPFTTSLRRDELLTTVRFPIPDPCVSLAFAEVAVRKRPVVGALVAVRREQGVCTGVEAGLAGVGATPLLVSGPVGGELVGHVPARDRLVAAARAAAAGLTPPDTLQGSGAYRRRVAERLLLRVLEQATEVWR